MKHERRLLKRTCRPVVALALGVTGILWSAGPVRAQLIQTLFPSDIPGYEPNLSASVLTRMINADEDMGVPVGSFIVRPNISENGGYQSNALGAPHTGSATLNTQASVRVNSDWEQNAVGASLAVDNERYLQLPKADYTNWLAGVGGAVDVGNDIATGSYSHSVTNLTAQDLGVTGIVDPVAYSIDDLRLSYAKLFARFSLTPGIEVQNYLFGKAADTDVNDDLLNHTVETGSLTGRYGFSPGDAAVFILRYSQAQFSKNRTNNYDDGSVFIGLDWRGTSIIQYRALIGLESRHFPNAHQTDTTPTFELDLAWTPTQLDTVTLMAFRSETNPTMAFALNQTVTQGRIQLDHELHNNVFLRADAQLGVSNAQTTNGDLGSQHQTQIQFGAAAFWNINQYLRATLSYQYFHGSSRVVVETSANENFPNFTDHMIMLGVTAFE